MRSVIPEEADIVDMADDGDLLAGIVVRAQAPARYESSSRTSMQYCSSAYDGLGAEAVACAVRSSNPQLQHPARAPLRVCKAFDRRRGHPCGMVWLVLVLMWRLNAAGLGAA